MKKLIILTSVLGLAAMSGMSQGYVSILNGSTAGIIKVQDPNVNGGVAATIGSPANAAGFTACGPGTFTVEVFFAAAGTDMTSAAARAALLQTTPYAVGTSSANATLAAAQGSFAVAANAATYGSGNPFTLPTSGSLYNGSAPVEFEFYAYNAAGTYGGWSSLGSITPVTSGPAPAVFGTGAGQINSFVVNPLVPIPEPTTIALGGLGAAALLLFRRKK